MADSDIFVLILVENLSNFSHSHWYVIFLKRESLSSLALQKLYIHAQNITDDAAINLCACCIDT